MDLRDKIYNEIKEREWVSFAELRRLEGFDGDKSYGLIKENIIFWSWMSHAAIDAIEDLIAKKMIFMKSSDKLTYLMDGCLPNWPIAKSLRVYKEKRWLPVCFCTFPQKNTKQKSRKKS